MNCSSCRQDLPAAARFCPFCGTPCQAPAAPVPTTAPMPADERKPATVLFCDLVGSTALSEALDPETLRTVTLRYFALMSEQIEAHGGTPEKFIGDAVMAVFGVPVVREDDARRALAAALGMRRALAALNTELEATLGIRLHIRIGVNTGQVVAGADTTARQALVSGETVNVAARLEQNAGPGEILIGPQTLLAAGPTVVAEEVGPLRLKGKSERVRAHRLLALGGDDPELMRRFDVPFVGRRAELAALDRALDAAADGAVLLRITGEAGVGKTRLAREWLAGHTVRERPAHGAGRCRSYGEHGSLAPLADAVRTVVAPDGAAGPAGPEPAGDGRADREADDAMALLTGGLLRDGTPNAPFEDLCAALAAVLGRAARRRPVLLLLDDWHWAAPLLERTVGRLHALLGRAAVLTVCLGRPDGRSALPDGEAPGAPVLRLTGLPGPEAARLARELAGPGAGPVPAGLLDRAEGNPLYLEQLLVNTGSDGGVGGAVDLPPTLQALLGARIGALDRTERAVLDLAAVVGRDFTTEELARLTTAAQAAVQTAGAVAPHGDVHEQVREILARLSRRRLVEPAPGGRSGLHRFSSGLVQEVAYGSLAKRAKADRHEWAAQLPGAVAAGEGAVGGHLERAYRYRAELGLLGPRTERLRVRAANSLGRAGAQALARSDLHWADDLLRRSVELSEPGTAAAAPALRRLGEVRVALGHPEEGAELLRRVLDAGEAPVEAAHARLALAALSPAAENVPAVARSVLPVFEAAPDRVGLARARLRLGQQQQRTGRHEEADRELVHALGHAVRAEAEPERAAALGAIGISLWRGPEPVPVAVSRCRALLDEHGAGRPTVRVTLNCPLAVLYALQDRPQDARESLAEAERLASGLGYAEAQVFLPVFRATVEALSGRRGEALALLDRADEAARRTGATGMRPAIGLETARLLLDEGDPARARQRLAAVGSPRTLSRADAVDLTGLLARLAAAGGHADHALRHADAAVRTAALTDSPLVQATAALDRATALAALGLRDAASFAARSAAERFTDKGHLPGVRGVRRFLADLPGAMTTEAS